MLCSCGGSTPKTETTTGSNEYAVDESASDGIQRMPEYNYSDSINVGGKTFNYTIHRCASDSLPTVTDDEGTIYADNEYTLTLSRGNDFSQFRFTKHNFASYLSSEFRKKGILDGMMCDKSLPGLRFAVSVSLPQSDMFEPLLLTIDPNGGMTITRDERSDAELDEEGV